MKILSLENFKNILKINEIADDGDTTRDFISSIDAYRHFSMMSAYCCCIYRRYTLMVSMSSDSSPCHCSDHADR